MLEEAENGEVVIKVELGFMRGTIKVLFLGLLWISALKTKAGDDFGMSSIQLLQKADEAVLLAVEQENINIRQSSKFAKEALSFCKIILKNDSSPISEVNSLKMKSYFLLACYYGSIRDKQPMFAYYDSAWAVATHLKVDEYIAKVGSNLGVEILIEGEKALKGQEYLLKANKAAHRTGEQEILIKNQGALAFFYQSIGEYEKSLSLLRSNLKYLKGYQLDYSELTYISIANSFISLDMVDSAEVYLKQSLKLDEDAKLEAITASLRTFLARVYLVQGKIALAKKELTLALEIFKKYDRLVWPETYKNLGDVYLSSPNNDSSIYYFKKGIAQALEVVSSKGLSDCYLGLSKAMAFSGRYKEASIALEKHLALLKERGLISYKNEMIRADLIYRQERKLYVDSIQRMKEEKANELAVYSAEIEEQKIESYQYAAIVGWGVILIAVVFSIVSVGKIYVRNTQLNEERKKVREQLVITAKQELALLKQQQKIDESLRHAEKIQSSLLPHEELRENLRYAIETVYQTPHILSSDFYFYARRKEVKLFSVFSSQTKGVPGTLNNIMLHQKLNDLVAVAEIKGVEELIDDLAVYINGNLKKNNQANKIDLGILLLNENKISFSGFKMNLILERAGEVIRIFGADKSVDQRGVNFNVLTFDLLDEDVFVLGTPRSIQHYLTIRNEDIKNEKIGFDRTLQIMDLMRGSNKEEFCLIGFEYKDA